ncbi:MAG: chemotaxis protein [Methylophilaceae bacterium]
MTPTILPVTELRQLLKAVSDHGGQHLIEVETDLVQTTYLLSGAIEKLGDSFMAINEAVSAQQEIIDRLLNTVEASQESRLDILMLREKVSVEANAAVTGLQFQDMTSQLIARVIKRVNGLRETLTTLATHSEHMNPTHEHEEIVKLLAEMNASLHMRNDALVGGLAKSVRQEDMRSGEVELF